MNVVSLALLSAGVFASTNVDDLFVLAGFFSDRSLPSRQVFAGQVVGIAILVGISLAAAFAALSLSPERVGLLGVAPVIIGIIKLLRMHKTDHARQRRRGGVLEVAVITIANGGDNIGVYAPIFANQRPMEMAVTVAVFAALTLVWCLVALWLVRRPAIERPVRRYGRLILPFVLIGLGGMILYRSGAFDRAIGFASLQRLGSGDWVFDPGGKGAHGVAHTFAAAVHER